MKLNILTTHLAKRRWGDIRSENPEARAAWRNGDMVKRRWGDREPVPNRTCFDYERMQQCFEIYRAAQSAQMLYVTVLFFERALFLHDSARDWIVITCTGNQGRKPGRHNQITDKLMSATLLRSSIVRDIALTLLMRNRT